MDLGQALLLALVAGIAGVDYYLEVFQSYRPLVLGTVVGALMGDLTTGLIVGGTFELMWMGLMPIGGAQPPDMVIGTVVGVVFAIASGEGASTAIGIGVPFAVLMQGVLTLIRTMLAISMSYADKCAENADVHGWGKIQITSLVVVFVLYFIVAFLPIYLGADQAEFIASIMPEWVINGLTVAGSVMPAIGFAILLNTMWRAEYIIFFAIGFVMVAYAGLPILAVAIVAACIAGYDFITTGKRAANAPAMEIATSAETEEYHDDL